MCHKFRIEIWKVIVVLLIVIEAVLVVGIPDFPFYLLVGSIGLLAAGLTLSLVRESYVYLLLCGASIAVLATVYIH